MQKTHVKWVGLDERHAVCREAEAALLDATITAEAFSPRVMGTAGNTKDNVDFVTASVRDGMLACAAATIAAAHDHLTTHPPRLNLDRPSTKPTPAQEKALWQISLWRVAQIWYGTMSAEARRMFKLINQNLDQLDRADPTTTESLVIALSYVACVRAYNAEGGDLAPFAPTGARRWLNNDSRLLDDPLAAYCLLEAADNAVVYLHLSERLRRNVKLNMHLVALAGDDVLSLVPAEAYAGERAAYAVELVRKNHYVLNPKRSPWLRVLATEPRLVFGRGSMNLVDVNAWRAQG